jgi:hypothetical protein
MLYAIGASFYTVPYEDTHILYKFCADFCCLLIFFIAYRIFFLNRPPKFDVVYSEAAFGHWRTDLTQINLAELLARFALSA